MIFIFEFFNSYTIFLTRDILKILNNIKLFNVFINNRDFRIIQNFLFAFIAIILNLIFLK